MSLTPTRSVTKFHVVDADTYFTVYLPYKVHRIFQERCNQKLGEGMSESFFLQLMLYLILGLGWISWV